MDNKSLQITSRQIDCSEKPVAPDVLRKPTLFDQIEASRRALLVSEVAQLLMISQRQVYKLAADQQIPSMKIAGCIRFDGVVLASWLRRNSGGAQ